MREALREEEDDVEQDSREAWPSSYAGKAPLGSAGFPVPVRSEESDVDIDLIDRDEDPDLDRYFGQWPDITAANRIAICRTYANHLAAVTRTTRTRGTYSKKRSRGVLMPKQLELDPSDE